MKVRYLFWLLLLPGLGLSVFQNCSNRYESGEGINSLSSLGNDAASIAIYEATLYPIIQNNCSACHGVSQVPRFAVSDPRLSHNTLLKNNLVSLSSPQSSKIVAKIRGGHNGFPTSLADDLLAAISDWSVELDTAKQGAAVDIEPTWSSIRSKILGPKCLNCHSPGGARATTDLTTHASVLASGTVTAGDAEASPLYVKCQNGQMPKNGNKLSDQELWAIRDWINWGAAND